ncbi:MAG TPA: hypothetical protein VGC42_14095 [Kofleriaceae bacterium]
MRTIGVLAVWLASAGCHVVTQNTYLRGGASERVPDLATAKAGPPAIELGEAGELRFLEPLSCATDERQPQRAELERVIGPNLATFTVGLIAAALGGVMLTAGAIAHDPGASPYTYAGAAGLALGLPLAIGPWLGNRTEVAPVLGITDSTTRRPGPPAPCGSRPVAARAATLTTSGLEIRGQIDRDGRFEISPYQWIDAYAAGDAPAAELRAALDGAPPRILTTVLARPALAARAAGFLARAGIDARVAPLRLVPNITATALRARFVATEHGPAVHLALALRNAGPGDAAGLRGQVVAPGAPAIDGRILYVGALGRAATTTAELTIPISSGAASALAGHDVDLSVELRDAYGTAPATPIRFHGVLPGDPLGAAP